MANSIQTIVRTAAMIYAEDQSLQTVKSVRRRFIDAVLVNTENTPQTIENIISLLQESFELVVQENDINSILNDNRYYEVIVGQKKSTNTYYLPQKRFQKLKEKSEYTIDDAINKYLSYNPGDKPEDLRGLLHRYMYYLLNANIGAYSQLLERKGNKKSPVIDTSSFSVNEIETINDFINWDNKDKDKSLFQLVNYSIEYATAINKIDPQDVVTALKNKSLYLDNALIYRALGINGGYRKDRAINLLQRCVSSGQKLIISSVTRKEFFDTIDYHISQLKGSTPYGRINPALFQKYTGGYTVYQYYHDWRKGRLVYGYDAFLIHIKQEYERLLQKFKIEEDFKQHFDDKDEYLIEQYANEIKQCKSHLQKSDNLHLNDAKNMVWVELSRNHCDNNVRDTKFYFVTSDRRLQEWDLTHSKNQPLTMLPSQWLALLLKYFSQSNDDYKSFVSFLTIPNEKSSIAPDDLQSILAGISEITEEFQRQDDIVSALLELNDKKFVRRESARQFAKDRIESEYREKILTIESDAQKKLVEQQRASNQLMENRISYITKAFNEEIRKNQIERIDDKIIICQNQLKEKKKVLNQINLKSNCLRKWITGIEIAIPCVYLLVMILLTFVVFDWNTMEPIVTFVGIAIAVLVLIISCLLHQKLEFWNIPSACRDLYFNHLCSQFDFCESDINDLEDSTESLIKQKGELEATKEID